MKIKLFNHGDLDAVGCTLVAMKEYGYRNVDVEYCDYNNINEKLLEFLATGCHMDYDKIYITDISVNEKMAELITTYHSDYIELYDHHPTALWLNKYDWATVEINGVDGIKISATRLFANNISSNYRGTGFEDIIFMMDSYDTWNWTVNGCTDAKRLNDLMYIIGRDRFIDSIVNNGYKIDINSGIYNDILNIEQEKIDRIIDRKHKNMINIYNGGYKVGVIFADNYQSEIGNSICKMDENTDLVAMINMDSKTVSFRTTKDEVDLSAFAKLYSGGGHAKASGCPITKEWMEVISMMTIKGE